MSSHPREHETDALAGRGTFWVSRLLSHSSTSGLLLLLAGVAALVWANSPWSASYHHIWHGIKLTVALGDWQLSHSLEWWVNDLLMVVFFLLVGMEIKKELLFGRLSSFKRAAAPAVAAIGGMLVPAALYLMLTAGTDRTAGWGVPMATDIAFSLAVLSVMVKFVSPGMRVFLVALAIVDDLGALLVIAIFYTTDVNSAALVWAGGVLAFMAMLNYSGVRSVMAYLLPGVALWGLVLASGIHATIAGVLIALTLPASRGPAGEESPLVTVEHAITRWVTLLILPIFALANSGVTLGGNGTTIPEVLADRAAWGIVAGLVIGKPVGIWLFTMVGCRIGICERPEGTSGVSILALGAVGGIGFTMALFIAKLAFPTNLEALDAAKIAVLGASVISACVGAMLLFLAGRAERESSAAKA